MPDQARTTPDVLTVRDLLAASAELMEEGLQDDSGSERLLHAAGATVDALGGVQARGTSGRILELLEEMLEIPLPEVLVEAWRRYEPFLEFADPDRHPPGVVHQVPLASHVVESTWHPAVEIVVNGVTTARIEFEAHLELSLEGAVVSVRDGRFRSVATGECAIEGQVRLGDLVLAERGPEALTLPGELVLGAGGIPIVPGREGVGEGGAGSGASLLHPGIPGDTHADNPGMTP